MSSDRQTERSRIHAYVNDYVAHVCTELAERPLPSEHEDFIDGLTREIGYGLEELLFDEAFPWSEDSWMTSELRDAEIGCLISVLSLAVIACRCARKDDASLFQDASLVYPGSGPFADELYAFIVSDVFSEAGKISNVWSRTNALLPSLIGIREPSLGEFGQAIKALTRNAEVGAEEFIAKGEAARDMGKNMARELAFSQAGDGGSEDDDGVGCIFVALFVVGGIIYYWFFT